MDVCNTIAYAHSRGVLHRDLKPGNIMLGQYGETLVVDWGLAKPQDQVESAETLVEAPLKLMDGNSWTLTQMGRAVGTPAFMSPEQAAGRMDLLGLASDVYSLGATLYCLLTGKAPIEGEKEMGSILDRVQKGDFPRPREVNAKVPPALEAICLKAMALKPADRYPTVRALAEDVERWLADDPVSAFPEPVTVKARRWAGRHRALVTGVGCLLIAAVVALAISTLLIGAEQGRTEAARKDAERNYQAAEQQRKLAEKSALEARDQKQAADKERERADQQRDQAQRFAAEAKVQQQAAETQRAEARDQADRAREVTQFLIGLFEASDPFGLNGYVFGAVNKSGEQVTAQDLLKRGVNQINKQKFASPRVQADLLDTIGGVYRSLGSHDDAEALLLKAQSIRVEAKAPAAELASSLHGLAWLNHQRGQYRTAVGLYREALKLRRAAAEPDDAAIANTLVNLGMIYLEMGQHAEAEKLTRECHDLRVKHFGAEHRETALAKMGLAAIYLDNAQPLKASVQLDQALQIFKKLGADQKLIQACALFQSGAVAHLMKNHVQAEAKLRESLQLLRDGLGKDHMYVTFPLVQLGMLLEQMPGKQAASAECYREAYDICRERVGLGHPKALLVVERLARVYRNSGETGKGTPLFEELLAAQQKRFGPDDPFVADVLFEFARHLQAASQKPRAVELLTAAVKIYRADTDSPRARFEPTLNTLAWHYHDDGKSDRAVPLFQQLLKLQTARLGPNHAETLLTMKNLVEAHQAAGQADKVVPLLEAVLEKTEARLGADHADTLQAKSKLAAAYKKAGNIQKAIPLYQQVNDTWKRKQGPEHAATLVSSKNLALAYMSGNQTAKAIPLYREILAAYVKKQPDDWTTFDTKVRLGAALHLEKKLEEAEPHLVKGYEGLKDRLAKLPATTRARLPQIAEQLVRLYIALDRPDDIARWRKELADIKGMTKKPSP